MASTAKAHLEILDITSSAFGNGQRIPVEHTKDGSDHSPALEWSKIPAATRSLAMICDDPDAPREDPWVHWVIYNMPATLRSIPERVSPSERPAEVPGASQGKNDFGDLGYGGPQPPHGHGTHHYHFKLFALDTTLDLPPGATKKELLDAIKGHVRATGEIVGTYSR
jgi:Raf kinase inhibitor-like YbhB/YbcL family protein